MRANLKDTHNTKARIDMMSRRAGDIDSMTDILIVKVFESRFSSAYKVSAPVMPHFGRLWDIWGHEVFVPLPRSF